MKYVMEKRVSPLFAGEPTLGYTFGRKFCPMNTLEPKHLEWMLAMLKEMDRKGKPFDPLSRLAGAYSYGGFTVFDLAVCGLNLLEQTQNEKEKKVKEDHTYQFVSSAWEVDYHRIIREAPKGILYILVQERSRNGRPQEATLFVHRSVLTDSRVQGMKIGNSRVSPEWGSDADPGNSEEPLVSFRYVSFAGKFPGYIKQHIERIRRATNEKNTKTQVTYL